MLGDSNGGYETFIPNEEVITNRVFGEMVMSETSRGSRGIGYIYQN